MHPLVTPRSCAVSDGAPRRSASLWAKEMTMHPTSSRIPYVLLALPSLAAAQCEVVKLEPGDTTPYLSLGTDVSWNDGVLAVSGRDQSWSWTAYFFEDTPTGWSLVDSLDLPPAYEGYQAHPLIYEGSTLLLGQTNHGDDAGRVVHYERGPGGFSLPRFLTPNAPLPESHFGRRIALDGDRMIVSAPMYPRQAWRGGAVFDFERVGGQWIERQQIEPTSPRSFGFFGLAVALEGDLLAVGEPGYLVFGGDLGRVFIYRRIGGAWQLEDVLEADNVGLGYSLVWDQGRLLAGRFQDDTHGGPVEGAVYTYEWSGSSWVVSDVLTTSSALADDAFGKSLEVDGDVLVVSSACHELLEGGRVHVYTRGGGSWKLQNLLGPHDFEADHNGPRFGSVIALDGEQLWITSPGEQQDSLAGGAVYGYTLASLTESYCGPAVPNSTGVPATLRGVGCPTVAQDDLALEADRLPPHQPCLFLVGRDQGFVQPPGSQGDLCLGGPIGRFDGVLSSNAAGFVLRFVDLGAIPLPNGDHAAQPGETWNFQCWYRDQNPGHTSNFTDGVQVTVR